MYNKAILAVTHDSRIYLCCRSYCNISFIFIVVLSGVSGTTDMFRRLLALVFALSLVLQHVAAIGLFELGFLSKIPSSCIQQWSKVKYLESGITIGRSCAVYKKQPTIHMQNYLSCTRGDQGCTSRRRNCISEYDEVMSRFVATGTITGSTNIYGYWASLNVSQTVFDTGAFSSFFAANAASSLVSAASYNPSFVYTSQSSCRGACSLNEESVQVFVWPTSTVSSNATTIAGKNQSTNGILNKNETRPYTLVSGGFTLYVSPVRFKNTNLNWFTVSRHRFMLHFSHYLPLITVVVLNHPTQTALCLSHHPNFELALGLRLLIRISGRIRATYGQ